MRAQERAPQRMFNSVLSGVISAVVMSLLLTVILAAILYFLPFPEQHLSPVSLAILLVSVFFGGNRAAKKVGGKGLIAGLWVGLVFFILMILITLVTSPASLGLVNSTAKLAYSVLAGVLGGISAVATM